MRVSVTAWNLKTLTGEIRIGTLFIQFSFGKQKKNRITFIEHFRSTYHSHQATEYLYPMFTFVF